MNLKQALASVALTGTLAFIVPAAPVYADGAASTRNIILFGAAATYLVIQHNRKVHEKYAEDARRQATLQSENNDAWAAYNSEQRAYNEQVSVNNSLRREVAYQHNVVVQQRGQLAQLNVRDGFVTQHVAQMQSPSGRPTQVALTSYGWGVI